MTLGARRRETVDRKNDSHGFLRLRLSSLRPAAGHVHVHRRRRAYQNNHLDSQRLLLAHLLAAVIGALVRRCAAPESSCFRASVLCIVSGRL